MKRNIIITIFGICFAIFFVIICTPDDEFEYSTPHVHAFIFSNDTSDFTRDDTTLFVVGDTVAPEDSLFFIGIFDTLDDRISNYQWCFGDGNSSDESVVEHAYTSSGIYHATFSIFSSVGDTLSDTVVVCVNVPPDSVKLISPTEESNNVALDALLSWKGWDDDEFDTSLFYSVIIFNDSSTPDTLIKWEEKESMTLTDGFQKGETLKWIVIARDLFGATTASDTGSFTLQAGDDATLSGITIAGKNLLTNALLSDTFFTDTVMGSVTSVEITVNATDPDARIIVNDSTIEKGDSTITLELPNIINEIAIKVVAADTVHNQTYVLQIVRKTAGNSLLSNLEVSEGYLSPAFSALIFSYADTVVQGTASLTITPTAQDKDASITINGKNVTSGSVSDTLALNQDKINEIVVKVTSEDGTTNNSYTIIVTIVGKELPAPSEISATALDTSRIVVTWNDNSSIENGFEIFRSMSSDGEFSVVDTVNANVTLFTDTGLQDGQKYFYKVRASSNDTVSTFSATASAVTKVTLSLTIMEAKGGTIAISPEKQMYNRGDTVTITATPDSGYRFTGWAGDVDTNENPIVIILDSSMHLEACFLNRPPFIVPLNDTSANIGSVFELQVTARDPDGDPITLLSGTLPTGASFNTTDGLFQWTPTDKQTGQHTITFAATDGQYTATDTVVISVFAFPNIEQQPENMEKCVGEPTKITVTATSSDPLSYQWRKDGTAIEGATVCSMTIESVISGDAGIYECLVTNKGGSVSSAPCTLKVLTPVSFNTQPAKLIKCTGETAQFKCVAQGSAPLSYQWQKNGQKIEGKTDTVLTIDNLIQEDAGIYTCLVTNGCGGMLSDSASLAVSTPSTKADGITVSASETCPKTSITLSVNGGSLGTGAVWKWYTGSCNGTSFDSGASITVTPLATTTYFVRAEGDCNTSECVSADVTVKTESTTPTGITADKTAICMGDSSVLQVEGGSLGTNAAWEWYSGASSERNYLGVGASRKVGPTVTTQYWLRGRGDCGNTDWVNITIMVGIPSVTIWFKDADNDGYTDSTISVQSERPNGYKWDFELTSTTLVDCDDNDSVLNPATIWYKDSDEDGYTDSTTITQCVRPGGFKSFTELTGPALDCNDNDSTVNPELIWYKDADNDGYTDSTLIAQCLRPSGYKQPAELVAADKDCDDDNKLANINKVWYKDTDGDKYSDGTNQNTCIQPVNYTLPELLIATTGDCDDNDASTNPEVVWYRDADNDGYSEGTTATQCSRPSGYKRASELTATSGDCDDGNATLTPATVWYRDADDDGYSNGTTATQCSRPNGYRLPSELTATSGDCDDDNAGLAPVTQWYCDADNDGYSNGATATQCSRPNGYKLASELTAISGDCDDGNAGLNPATVWYKDVDNDGYSDGAAATQCSRPVGYKLSSELTNTSGDCDDAIAALNPATVWYRDADNDGCSNGTTATQCSRPVGYKLSSELTNTSGDCDDNNSQRFPGNTEVCDGIDNNCNNQNDEGLNIAKPVITYTTVSSGTGGATLKITISCATQGTTIYWYKESVGSGSATVYSGPFNYGVSTGANNTIKAWAQKAGMCTSETVSLF